MAAWIEYQERVAEFFRTLGLDAQTNVRCHGVRTVHNIDVVVTSRHAGMAVTWIVECKLWKSRVSKDRVLALRAIVDDLGADRGILMAENGYQSGALEAATKTSTMLTSLADLSETLSHELGLAKLRILFARVEACRDRYWDLDKSVRIQYGLRPDLQVWGYSGENVILAVRETLISAFLDGFPLTYDRLLRSASAWSSRRLDFGTFGAAAIPTPDELFQVLDSEVAELERRLDRAESPTRNHNRESPPGASVRDN